MPHLIRRLLLLTVRVSDPWDRREGDIPSRLFGSGADRDFAWYLAGESTVRPTSLTQIQQWLVDCDYATDADLFHERDHWQHPTEFERLRRGDCEDFAVWTWRKLVELGYDAELVAGSYAGHAGGHAWVTFRRGDTSYVLDPVVRDRTRMIRPLHEVRQFFRPEFSVNARLQRFVYDGYLIRLRRTDRGPVLVIQVLHRILRTLMPGRLATYRLLHRAHPAIESPSPVHSIS